MEIIRHLSHLGVTCWRTNGYSVTDDLLHLSRLSLIGCAVTDVTVGCVASVTTYETECQDVMT